MKSSMFWIYSWWGFEAKTIMLHQGPPNMSIHTMPIKSCTCSIIILDSYSPYCKFLQKTGFEFHVFMDKLYPRIVHFVPSLQKQSQYLFTIAINFPFIYSITLLLNLICLCSSLLCHSSLNMIKFVQLPSYHVFLVLYTAFRYCWKSNTLSSISFA